jgi:hypothetical protein
MTDRFGCSVRRQQPPTIERVTTNDTLGLESGSVWKPGRQQQCHSALLRGGGRGAGSHPGCTGQIADSPGLRSVANLQRDARSAPIDKTDLNNFSVEE